MTSTDLADDSRREFLRLGLSATAVLATAGLAGSLVGCSTRETAAAQGYTVLRDADLQLLRALTPVVLEGVTLTAADLEQALRIVDNTLAQAQPPALKSLFQLFDLLHLRLTRWAVAGITAPWSEATAEQIDAFLLRWRNSSIGLLNAGYRVLTRLCAVGYYGSPQGAQASGYPGPLEFMFKAVNA